MKEKNKPGKRLSMDELAANAEKTLKRKELNHNGKIRCLNLL